MNKAIKLSIIFGLLLLANMGLAVDIPASKRSLKVIASIKPQLERELASAGLAYGNSIYIRIFKASRELELWVKKGKQYQLFKTYEICNFSGGLGPKTTQGDNQAPEGFYFVTAGRLNPWSTYHLSFNLGYPNAFERHHGYTGSALMVHGKCVSIGCFAMTDRQINEIYSLAHAALENGQPFFRVHSFPFKMEGEILNQYKTHKWYSFWLNLKEGYDYFEKNKTPPNVTVEKGMYVFDLSP